MDLPFYDLPATTGVTIAHPTITSQGEHVLSYGGTTMPSAGTVTLEYRLYGDAAATWRAISAAAAVPANTPFRVSVLGLLEQVRVTLAGVSNGSKLFLRIDDIGTLGIPLQAFEGMRALTVQNYVEANVKNGVQYEVSAYVAALGAGAVSDTIFRVGSKPVLIKARQIQFDGVKLEARVYKAPAFTGGTPIPFFNLNTRNPVAGTVQVLGAPTVSSPGTEIGAPGFLVGSNGQGQSTLGTYAVTGNERLLLPNTDFLLRITNTAAVAQQVSVYVSWYEGDTDLPI